MITIVQSLKPPGLPNVGQIIATVRGLAESNRAFTDDIPKRENADESDKPPLHE
jgi:hypothetical protein